MLKWLDEIWKKISSQIVKNSFKKCGFSNDVDIDIDVELDFSSKFSTVKFNYFFHYSIPKLTTPLVLLSKPYEYDLPYRPSLSKSGLGLGGIR